jgi:hypothetical protein
MRLSLLRQMFVSNLRRNTATSSQTAAVSNETDKVLRKIDLKKELSSLPQAQQMYIKRIIEKNNERHAREMKLRFHHRVSGAILVSIVLMIYFYSMYAVKQEKFLDDFDIPVPPDNSVKSLQK